MIAVLQVGIPGTQSEVQQVVRQAFSPEDPEAFKRSALSNAKPPGLFHEYAKSADYLGLFIEHGSKPIGKYGYTMVDVHIEDSAGGIHIWAEDVWDRLRAASTVNRPVSPRVSVMPKTKELRPVLERAEIRCPVTSKPVSEGSVPTVRTLLFRREDLRTPVVSGSLALIALVLLFVILPGDQNTSIWWASFSFVVAMVVALCIAVYEWRRGRILWRGMK